MTTETQPKQQALTPAKQFEQQLAQRVTSLKTLLPANVTPEKFARITALAVMNNEDLLKCNRESLFTEVLKCASDGLMPDGRDAAIVPFKGTAKYMPMVAGICKRARNSGAISMIDSFLVYENDSYDSWIDENGPHFKYKRAYKNRGDIVLTVAYAKSPDGQLYLEEVDNEEMRLISEASKAGNSPWKGPFYTEMMRKSAIRRLAKYKLPSSSEVFELVTRDDEFYDIGPKTEEFKKEEYKKAIEAKHVEMDEVDSMIKEISIQLDKVNAGKSANEKALFMLNVLKVKSLSELKKFGLVDLKGKLAMISGESLPEEKINKQIKEIESALTESSAEMFVENMIQQGAVND